MTQLTLSGQIRDFKDSHADFEHVIATEKNIVGPVLGEDHKPIYKGGQGKTTTGKENFDHWFRDVEGINLNKRLAIVLNDSDKNDVFTYENSNFFPIDNELFGNQGREHNYHFTYEIHSEFTYQGTEAFTFIGDDDLWVYINGKLVIDLGGVHSAQQGDIDLSLEDDTKTQLKKPLASGEVLELTKGKNYSFDLFFAERHTTKSHFRIDTSMLLKILPIATLVVKDAAAQEYPNDTGMFSIQLDKPAESDMVIQYAVSGTATQGTDYKNLRTGKIPAGEKAVDILVEPMLDDLEEETETVILTLLPGNGYELGECKVAQVSICDASPRNEKLKYLLICLVFIFLAVCGCWIFLQGNV